MAQMQIEQMKITHVDSHGELEYIGYVPLSEVGEIIEDEQLHDVLMRSGIGKLEIVYRLDGGYNGQVRFEKVWVDA